MMIFPSGEEVENQQSIKKNETEIKLFELKFELPVKEREQKQNH